MLVSPNYRFRVVAFGVVVVLPIDQIESLQLAEYTVTDLPYQVGGQQVRNLEAILVGSRPAQGEVIVGAHYDTVAGTAGANDNATGVAATLELARLMKESRLPNTVRFLLFANEEPPYFQTVSMGSRVYARHLRHENVRVSAMISLETIGFYSDAQGAKNTLPS